MVRRRSLLAGNPGHARAGTPPAICRYRLRSGAPGAVRPPGTSRPGNHPWPRPGRWAGPARPRSGAASHRPSRDGQQRALRCPSSGTNLPSGYPRTGPQGQQRAGCCLSLGSKLPSGYPRAGDFVAQGTPGPGSGWAENVGAVYQSGASCQPTRSAPASRSRSPAPRAPRALRAPRASGIRRKNPAQQAVTHIIRIILAFAA